MRTSERVTTVDVALVTIGDSDAPAAAQLLRAVVTGGTVQSFTLPAVPSIVQYDAVLDAAAGRRLVMDASPSATAGLLRRMMRRGELATTETAVLEGNCRFLEELGLSRLAGDALDWVGEPCRTVGVLKDDSGNLVIDSAELRPWQGRRVWVRAYVDDECLCDGEIPWLRVEHRVGGGLRASVPGRFGRTRSLEGRALQLACEDAAISSDGDRRDQPRRKRIWWNEPDQWRLACPPPRSR